MFKKTTAKFGKEPVKVEEVYTGYLHKSPGQSTVFKTFKSWKQRFFVLSKTDKDTYHLTYYLNEKREKPLGIIDTSKIGLMCIGVEKHQMWGWIQKHFNCPPASVLFLTVNDTQKHRDYFLIGKNSEDVDGWHNALDKTMKTQISSILRHTGETLQDIRFRSTSEPVKCPEPKVEDRSNERRSSPELMEGHYDLPRKYSEPLLAVESKISLKEDKDEKNGEPDESPEESSEYMAMSSVKMALEDDQQEVDTTCIPTNEDFRQSKQSLLNFNGIHVSTELNKAHFNNRIPASAVIC